MSDDSARDLALRYLLAHHVATLASAGPEGPWAAAVFYASRDFDLYFVSSPTSRHAVDVSREPAAAATVQEDYADWRRIRGIQIEGTVEMLSGASEAGARALYASKFPVIARDTPPEIAAALAKARWYRLLAKRAYYVDNTAGFGRRVQVL